MSGSPDKFLQLWDSSTRKPTISLQGHTNKIYFAQFQNSDPNILASCGQDDTIRIWDIRKTEPVKTIMVNDSLLYCVRWSKDGKYLASSDINGVLRLFDKNFNLVCETPSIPDNRSYMLDLDFTHSPTIYQSQMTDFLKVWDFDEVHHKLTEKMEKNIHCDETRCVSLKKKYLATGSKVSFRLIKGFLSQNLGFRNLRVSM